MVVGLAHSSIFFRPLALEPMYLASHPCSRGHAVHYTVQEILVRLGVAMVLTHSTNLALQHAVDHPGIALVSNPLQLQDSCLPPELHVGGFVGILGQGIHLRGLLLVPTSQ